MTTNQRGAWISVVNSYMLLCVLLEIDYLAVLPDAVLGLVDEVQEARIVPRRVDAIGGYQVAQRVRRVVQKFELRVDFVGPVDVEAWVQLDGSATLEEVIGERDVLLLRLWALGTGVVDVAHQVAVFLGLEHDDAGVANTSTSSGSSASR